MIETLIGYVIPAAYELLPKPLRSDKATRELLAIGFQESRFKHRLQVNGPARGFWQFEKGGGTRGVLYHPRTKEMARHVVTTLRYEFDDEPVYHALAHNDVLAFAMARLFLYQHKDPLPDTMDAGWQQYIETWRPGKPHQRTWPVMWQAAEDALSGKEITI